MTKRLGFIGLGAMGVPMVKNLLKAGFPVTVYARDTRKALALADDGAQVAPDLLTLAERSDVIITMLTNDAAVSSVMEGEAGLLAQCRPGHVIIDMSTIAPGESRRLGSLAADHGLAWLDAPVSGSVKPAQDGTLVILAGGDEAVFERCRDIFAVLGKKAIYFGPRGLGSVAKLVVNAILGVQLQVLGEAVVLAERNGLGRREVLEMIGETAVASPIVLAKTPSLLAGTYPRAFGLALQQKDLGLAVTLARESGAAMPVTLAAHQTYTAAVAGGLGDEDVAAIVKQLEQMAPVAMLSGR